MAEAALAGPNLNLPAASPTPRRLVVVDGASLGIMSFAFGVFDAAGYYGALPELDVRIVSGEPDAAMRGGGLAYDVPLRPLRDPRGGSGHRALLAGSARTAARAAAGIPAPRARRRGRMAGMCSRVFVLAVGGGRGARPPPNHKGPAGVLAQMYPKISVRASVLYIDDGDILTAGGGAAGMDWPLWTTP